MVRVDGLSRRFAVGRRELQALEDVSFTVAEGETLGIVGESGCGKSTLARLLVGLDRATGGQVSIGGLPVPGRTRRDRLRLARMVQMVFQDPFASLNPRMRVGKIVTEPLAIHTSIGRARRAGEAVRLLHRVGLPGDAARRHPHAFSGGQRQRIGIARALALHPRVLVADEPVSALDVSVQAQILNLLADLRDELGLTVILVSHDLHVVRWISDRVMVMYLGRVVEMGPCDAVLGLPAHPYTRSLLASAPRVDDTPGALLDGPIGEPASALDPPTGCPFHPRCPIAQALCGAVAPRLEPVGASSVACHDAQGWPDAGAVEPAQG